jgi:hypothetical protein
MPRSFDMAAEYDGSVEQVYRAFSDERYWLAKAVVKGSIPGAPAELSGTAVLAPAGAGSRLKFNATVEVRIPLVGGKVENFIGNQLVDLLIAEQRFTTEWLRTNP